MSRIYRILDNLYISDATAASDADIRATEKISHMLAVAAYCTQFHPRNYEYRCIPLIDVETEDLVTALPQCIAFLDLALAQDSNRVLVHWYLSWTDVQTDCRSMAGVSRCSAVVIGYLIVKRSMSYDDAFALVQGAKADVCPNPGFERQLRLLSEAKGNFDLYKKKSAGIRATILADGFLVSGSVDLGAMAEDPVDRVAKTLPPPMKIISSVEGVVAPPVPGDIITVYTCRKCRRPLFMDENVLPHERGHGQRDFAVQKRSFDKMYQIPECTSYFVEPISWMTSLGGNEMKIDCPKCASRIGSVTWAGAQCSCGRWIAPAIQVLKSKVDATERLMPTHVDAETPSTS